MKKFWLAPTLLLVASAAFAQSLTPVQRKCIYAMNKQGFKVFQFQEAQDRRCLALAGNEKLTQSSQDCLAQARGVVVRQLNHTAAIDAATCKAAPPFAYTGADAVNSAGLQSALDLMTDVFGSDFDSAAAACAAGRPDCQCQRSVLRQVAKVANQDFRRFLDCKLLVLLRSDPISSVAIQRCVDDAAMAQSVVRDRPRRVRRTIKRMEQSINSQCSVNAISGFQGRCQGLTGSDLADCLVAAAECRVCQAINGMDGLNVDCDMFDDATANGSCGNAISTPTSTPTITPTPTQTPTISPSQTATLTATATPACAPFGETCGSGCCSGLSCSGVGSCECASGFACGSSCCAFGEECDSGTCVNPPSSCQTFDATVRDGGTCVTNPCPTTCLDILHHDPSAQSGVYMIDPSNSGMPFPVRCDMRLDGGGWTLIGYEQAANPSPANSVGAMAYLYLATGSENTIASGSGDGFTGPRFAQGTNYESARLNWCDPSAPANKFLKFNTPQELFADSLLNTSATTIHLTSFTTNDSFLASLVTNPDDARFCRAATSTSRPGDTSWGVKGSSDNNFQCGCSSGGWAGVGSYYGGINPNCTSCACWGGGWAGSVTSGQQKGSINKFQTYFWIR